MAMFLLLGRSRARLQVAVRWLSQGTAPKKSPPAPPKDAPAVAAPPPSQPNGGGGGARRSRFRPFLAVSGVAAAAGGSVIAAYHLNDDFRELVDATLSPDRIQSLKQFFHGLIGNDPVTATVPNSAPDDFELARQPDVPLEDLEETPATATSSAKSTLPSDLLRSEQFRAYLHVLVQEREDALRDEFNAHLDHHIAERLQTQLDAKSRELQSKYDIDLIAKKQELDARAAAERAQRIHRMEEIESQVARVDDVVQHCEEERLRSEKAHALTAAAIHIESALDAAASVANDLSLLQHYADDETISVLLGSLPEEAKGSGSVPTFDQIRHRFKAVSKACRQAALAPPGSGIIGYVIGRVFAMLLINRDAYVYGDDDLSKIHRGQYFLAQAELDNAVREIESLAPDGLARTLSSDWLSEAKKRAAIEQVAAVLKLYAYELSQARVHETTTAQSPV